LLPSEAEFLDTLGHQWKEAYRLAGWLGNPTFREKVQGIIHKKSAFWMVQEDG
jgi:hypothetical protein